MHSNTFIALNKRRKKNGVYGKDYGDTQKLLINLYPILTS